MLEKNVIMIANPVSGGIDKSEIIKQRLVLQQRDIEFYFIRNFS
jgi:hypothetical protein